MLNAFVTPFQNRSQSMKYFKEYNTLLTNHQNLSTVLWSILVTESQYKTCVLCHNGHWKSLKGINLCNFRTSHESKIHLGNRERI